MRWQPLSLQIWRAEASNCRWTDDCCKGESSSEESEEEEETSVDDWEVNGNLEGEMEGEAYPMSAADRPGEGCRTEKMRRSVSISDL